MSLQIFHDFFFCLRRNVAIYGITHNNANGSSKTEVAMMDMNGDGFPRVVTSFIR